MVMFLRLTSVFEKNGDRASIKVQLQNFQGGFVRVHLIGALQQSYDL